MTVRPLAAEDLPAIAAIQSRSPEASQWNPASYFSHDCLVAKETKVLGFLVARRTAPDEREILNIAVDPGERRKGVARALLEAELGRGKNQWFLEVRESNSCAIKLYESVSFRVVARRESYYENPPEAAIVMKFDS
jgi:ribosomal-protein-alanine N-acetyltransferase